MSTQEIIHQLQKFETAECGLFHEKVLVDKTTGEPLQTNVGDETHYQRVQLCPAEIRNHRLGCAHSSANHNFLNLVNQLNSQDENINRVKNDIEASIQKIYSLDHEKGDLEKDLVESENTSFVQSKIDVCVSKHTKVMRKLAEDKKEIIRLISTL